MANSRQEGRTDNISAQLERLKSPNKSTRFDACEMLRIAPSIPPQAIDALRLATQDPDQLVAEAAGRALALHMQPVTVPAVNSPEPAGFWGSPWNKLLAVAALFLAAFLFLGGVHWLAWHDLHGIPGWLLTSPVFYMAFFTAGDYLWARGPAARLVDLHLARTCSHRDSRETSGRGLVWRSGKFAFRRSGDGADTVQVIASKRRFASARSCSHLPSPVGHRRTADSLAGEVPACLPQGGRGPLKPVLEPPLMHN